MRSSGRLPTPTAGTVATLFAAALSLCGCSTHDPIKNVDKHDLPKHASPLEKARAREAIGEQQYTHPAELPKPEWVEPPPPPAQVPDGDSRPPAPAKPPPPQIDPQ